MDWQAVKFDWNRARAFLATAEEGSFSAAARALGSTQPTVGRQVAALEIELGVTLFARSGTRLELTESGLELLEHTRSMGDAAVRFSLAATGQSTSVQGEVIITASEAISAFLLPPVITRLRVEHPGISLTLVASNDLRDLHRREADIAVRNVRPARPSLFGRRVGDLQAGMYASVAYVDRVGPFNDLDQLGRAEFIGFDPVDELVTGLAARGLPVSREQFTVVSANHLVQWALCRQGAGICFMMTDVGNAEPDVVRILPDFELLLPTWLVCHRELRTSRRLRIVFDALADALAESL